MPAKAESRTARLSLMIPGPSTCSLAGVCRFSLCAAARKIPVGSPLLTPSLGWRRPPLKNGAEWFRCHCKTSSYKC